MPCARIFFCCFHAQQHAVPAVFFVEVESCRKHYLLLLNLRLATKIFTITSFPVSRVTCGYCRFLAEALRSAYSYLDDFLSDASVYVKVKARELCCYPTPGKLIVITVFKMQFKVCNYPAHYTTHVSDSFYFYPCWFNVRSLRCLLQRVIRAQRVCSARGPPARS